jgi:hypothetical protein
MRKVCIEPATIWVFPLEICDALSVSRRAATCSDLTSWRISHTRVLVLKTLFHPAGCFLCHAAERKSGFSGSLKHSCMVVYHVWFCTKIVCCFAAHSLTHPECVYLLQESFWKLDMELVTRANHWSRVCGYKQTEMIWQGHIRGEWWWCQEEEEEQQLVTELFFWCSPFSSTMWLPPQIQLIVSRQSSIEILHHLFALLR